MEAKVAADPHLAALAEQHRELSAQLRGAFIRSPRRPFLTTFSPCCPRRPMWLTSALLDARALFLHCRNGRRRLRPWRLAYCWATIVPQRSPAPVAVHDGQIYAASAVNRALDVQLGERARRGRQGRPDLPRPRGPDLPHLHHRPGERPCLPRCEGLAPPRGAVRRTRGTKRRLSNGGGHGPQSRGAGRLRYRWRSVRRLRRESGKGEGLALRLLTTSR